MKVLAKFTCLALTAALGTQLAACSAQEAVSAALPQEEEAESQAANYAPASFVDSERKDKTETVYIDASAEGVPQKVSVEAVLKNPGGSEPITDESTLSDIKNTEGDEEFTQNGTTITWQNHGADIHYKGTTSAELPVGVQIEYLLNGQPIDPQKLAGQSGHVTIRFTYTNRETRMVSRSGKSYAVSVPFTAVSLLSLPSDSFYNVTVDNGQVTQMDDNLLVVGYALPGLTDSLRLASYEPTEDIDIPESVEISCDTTDFSLEFTATVFSPGLLSDADLSNLDDVDDFIADMEYLKDGVNDLADGTRELNDGVQELYDGTVEYTDGVSEVNDAVQKLIDGLRDAAKSDSEMLQGTKALSDGWLAVLAQLLEAPDLTYENCAERLPEALGSWAEKSYREQVQAALQQLVSGMLTWEANAEDETLVNIPQEMQPVLGSDTMPATQYRQFVMDLLADSLNTTYQKRLLANAAALMAGEDSPGAEQQQAAFAAALAGWAGNRYALLNEGGDAAQLSDTLTEEESAACTALTGAAAAEIAKAMLPLLQGTGKLSTTLADAFNGMADTVGKLKEGTQALADAGEDLKDGIQSLHDGTTELADGVQEFKDDGVSALTDLAGDDLKNLVERVRAVQQADRGYTNFSGLADGKTGSVSFIFETAEIKND